MQWGTISDIAVVQKVHCFTFGEPATFSSEHVLANVVLMLFPDLSFHVDECSVNRLKRWPGLQNKIQAV